MRAGISTACYYPQHTEDALRTICSFPVQCAEVFTNCDSEISSSYLKELRHIADSSGVSLVSLHPYTSGMEPMLFFTEYDRRFEQGRDYYKRFYEAAAQLGASYVVFHGGVFGVAMSYEEYCERYGILWEDSLKAGVELCHENVCRCVGRSPAFFEAMLRELPQAGFVFDVKQAIRSDLDVFEMAKTMAPNIRHVHINDHKYGEDCLPPGFGAFHIDNFLSIIRSAGFDGAVVVEIYRQNFTSDVQILASYEHLSRKLSPTQNF